MGTVGAIDADSVGSLQDWTIQSGNTDGVFVINSTTGELTIGENTNLDFETTSAYTLLLTVADGVNTSAVETVRISINDQNEPPTLLTTGPLAVDENSGPGSLVGIASAVDPDTGDVLTWAIAGGNTGGAFTIDAATGQLRVANPAAVDYETHPAFNLLISVSDSSGLTDATTVSITLNDVNEVPTDLILTGPTVAENAANGTHIGVVTGIDPDAADSLTYTLTDTAGGRFDIDATSGAVTVSDGTNLDFESAATHSITVQTTDVGGLTLQRVFTIAVNDVNEAPVGVTETFAVVGSDSLIVSESVLLNDVDADGDILTAILTTDVEHGQLTLNSDGSFAYTANIGFGGTDAFEYQAADGLLLSNRIRVEIVVQPFVPVVIPVDNSDRVTEQDSDSDDQAPAADDFEPTDSLADLHPTPQAVQVIQTATVTVTAQPMPFIMTSFAPNIAERTGMQPILDELAIESKTASASDRNSLRTRQRTDARESIRVATSPITTEALMMPFGVNDNTSEQWQSDLTLPQLVVGTTTVVSTGLSVGYVVWLLRGGSLMASFLSAMPAWQSFDPLPIVESFEAAAQSDDDDSQESLTSLVS